MASISPFRALRYDPQRVPLSQVVTQPYDKITPQMQDHYYDVSPYNLVRIILGKKEPADTEHHNVYTRAATFFRVWRRQGIFLQDSEPSLYNYSQKFVIPGSGQELERRGFIGLGRIEDYPAGIVFRHEQTLTKPKADRLELLRATHAHFGQIFVLYKDNGEIDDLLVSKKPPAAEITDEYGVLHRLWRISDPAILDQVSSKMRDKKLIIADGHHRYETALNYRNEQRAIRVGASAGNIPRQRSADGPPPPTSVANDAPSEFVMMTFVNMNSPGLLILPTHRVVHGLSSFSAERLQSDARAHFTVEQLDASIDARQAASIFREKGRTGTALLAITQSSAFLMHTPKSVDSQLFSGLSVRQQGLDVVQLHRCLLEGVLGLTEESIRSQQHVTYLRDAGEALASVRGGGANAAFLMNPVRIEQVRDIALAGEVLPQKSTDFYPKLLSGLTIYALD